MGNIKATESAILRMKKAREERAYIQFLKDNGKHYRPDGSNSQRSSKSPCRSRSRQRGDDNN